MENNGENENGTKLIEESKGDNALPSNLDGSKISDSSGEEDEDDDDEDDDEDDEDDEEDADYNYR